MWPHVTWQFDNTYGTDDDLVKDWTQWIYKTDTSDIQIQSVNILHRCNLICIFDQQCDYITQTIPCCFGSFSYSGDPVTGPSEVGIRFKIVANVSDTTLEDNKFMLQPNKGVPFLNLNVF